MKLYTKTHTLYIQELIGTMASPSHHWPCFLFLTIYTVLFTNVQSNIATLRRQESRDPNCYYILYYPNIEL